MPVIHMCHTSQSLEPFVYRTVRVFNMAHGEAIVNMAPLGDAMRQAESIEGSTGDWMRVCLSEVLGFVWALWADFNMKNRWLYIRPRRVPPYWFLM